MAAILTLTEAAGLIGKSYPTLRRRVESGDLRAVRKGRDYEVLYSDVLAFIVKSRTCGDAAELQQESTNDNDGSLDYEHC